MIGRLSCAGCHRHRAGSAGKCDGGLSHHGTLHPVKAGRGLTDPSHPVLGGLRGALALAQALAAPEALPGRDALIGVAFAVVAFSIFVQGLTVPALLKLANREGISRSR